MKVFVNRWPAVLLTVGVTMGAVPLSAQNWTLEEKERRMPMSWPAPDKSVEFRYEGSLEAEGRFGLFDSLASTTQWLGQEYGCEEIPAEVKWSKDSDMVWVRTGGDRGDPLFLLCHRQDVATGTHYLEELKLPDLKRLIMQYGDESPEALLIGHPERVKAFVADEYMGIDFEGFSFAMAPLNFSDKRGWFQINLQYNSRFNGWPHYKLWISSADRVQFKVERIVRVQNYFRNMVHEKKKDGTLYDRAAGLGNPEIPIELSDGFPDSPDGKLRVWQQAKPERKDKKVALFVGPLFAKGKAVPVLPDEVFENPALEWGQNSGCALLTEGPADNRVTRLLVLRKDAVAGTVYMNELKVAPLQPWHLVNFKPEDFPRFDAYDSDGRPENFRCLNLSFTKPDLYDGGTRDGESRRVDRNLGIIYELQAAEKDATTGKMKVKTGTPAYRITLASPDWLRFAFLEVVKIDGDRRTILYKNDNAEPN